MKVLRLSLFVERFQLLSRLHLSLNFGLKRDFKLKEKWLWLFEQNPLGLKR